MWPFRLSPWQNRDEDPAFFVQVRFDGDMANGALSRLRKHYPDARIILVSDGDDDPAHRHLATHHHAEYVQDAWLYGLESGGRMIERMLKIFLKGRGTHLIKIDTDTRFDRTFSSLPKTDGVFGVLLPDGQTQGGCVIIPKTTARTLLRSGIFLRPELTSPEVWGKLFSKPFLANRIRTTGMIGFEWVLHWGCCQIGIHTYPWPEIHSTWKAGIVNADLRFAVVHPDKFISSQDEMIHDQEILTHAMICDALVDKMYADA